MKKRQIPFALYNVLLCALTAVVFILGVLCVQAAEERWYLKLDVSPDKVTKLSDYTLSRLDALQEDVTIHIVHSPGSSTLYDLQQETLLKLAAECDRVHLTTIDPEAQPHLLLALTGDVSGVADSTVFVQNAQSTRTVRIDPEEFLFARRIGNEQYTIYCGEAMLIGGIDRVVDEDPAAVWFISGHNEPDADALSQAMLQCRAMGLEIRTGSMSLMTPKPGDAAALIGPQTDLTAAEADLLKGWLNNGVHLIVACDADRPVSRLTNLQALCDLYGLNFRDGWVVENPSETAWFVDEPGMLTPSLQSGNGVLDVLPGRLILPRACALAEPELRPGVSAKVLLTTSDRAVLKANKAATTYTAENNDKSGAVPLAILAHAGDTYILQMASVQMLLSTAEADGAYVLDASENLAFLTACLEKMTDTGEGATLDAGVKQLATQLISFDNQQERQMISAVLMGFWPGLLTVAMFIVLIRRRRL